MVKDRTTIISTLARASSLALVVLQLQSAQGQVPTWAPTSSMWPTSTPIPTGSAYPTSTWMPTSTPLPTVTAFPSTTPPEVPTTETTTSAPTPGIEEIETAPPTTRPTAAPVASTNPPTRRPTPAPVETAPVPIPTSPPTKAPTRRPTAAPTVAEVPTVTPTGSPVVTPTGTPTSAPTAGPTAAPVVTATDPPTAGPTTLSPTTSPTTSPTLAPTAVPTMTAESVTANVDGIRLSLVNAGQLSTDQLDEWVAVTNAWFNTYFINNGQQSGVRNMIGFVSVVSQQELEDSSGGSDVPVNLITYDQRLNYDALPTAPDAQVLALLPYGMEAANAEYANLLKQRFPSVFGGLQTPIEVPEFASPTEMPTEAPSDAPSLAPVPTAPPTVLNMTAMPTTAAPTVENMTTVPTTVAPTEAPTEAPDMGTMVEVALRGITIPFVNAGQLGDDEIQSFQRTMADWFENYYLQDTGGNSSSSTSSPERRRLQDSTVADRTAVRDMSSTISVKNQAVETTNGVRTNTVTYVQSLKYIAFEGASDPEEYATLPFEDQTSNAELGLALRQFENFGEVRLPLEVPAVPDQSQFQDGGDDGLETGAIVGIAVGGAVALLGLGLFGYSQMRDGGEYKDSDQLPPSQFNVSADEDISTMDEPITSKLGDQPSLGGYGDQSVATVDYDYSKAYGGGDTSVVSSAGGTMGDATRQTGDVTASGRTALTALGAEANYGETLGTKDEVIEIYAPAGKLGVVIDTPDDGAPVVHAVKDSSVIADQIQVGDKLIAVDDDDVRSMTAIKVSKLISKKSANPSRKLTIIRTSMLDDPEG